MKEEKSVRVEFVRAQFIRGAWVSLIVEKRNRRLKRLRGLVMNSPILFLQKANGEIENVPIARIVEVEEYLSPKEAKQMMIKARAYRLAKEMRKRERLIARYDRFLISRLREEGRLR